MYRLHQVFKTFGSVRNVSCPSDSWTMATGFPDSLKLWCERYPWLLPYVFKRCQTLKTSWEQEKKACAMGKHEWQNPTNRIFLTVSPLLKNSSFDLTWIISFNPHGSFKFHLALHRSYTLYTCKNIKIYILNGTCPGACCAVSYDGLLVTNLNSISCLDASTCGGKMDIPLRRQYCWQTLRFFSRFEGAKRLKIMSAMKGVGEITQNMIRC